MIRDLLLPRTDAGVALQAAIAVVAMGVIWWSVRRSRREIRIFVAGLTVLVVAAFGLRALH